MRATDKVVTGLDKLKTLSAMIEKYRKFVSLNWVCNTDNSSVIICTFTRS